MKITTRAMKNGVISPEPTSLNVLITAEGSPATMPEKMMREIPFPIPRSVICSPSHIRNAVPAVRVMTASSRNPQPPMGTTMAPPGLAILSRPIAIPNPWMMLRTMVPYLVYWTIFFRPCSPSFFSFSR